MQVPGKKIFQGEAFFTDWQPRGGDGFILRGQFIDKYQSGGTGITVSIEIWTKNSEETGDGAQLTAGGGGAVELEITDSSTDVEQVFFPPAGGAAGVMEMVRLKVTTTGGAAGDWMLMRTFPFLWFFGAQ